MLCVWDLGRQIALHDVRDDPVVEVWNGIIISSLGAQPFGHRYRTA